MQVEPMPTVCRVSERGARALCALLALALASCATVPEVAETSPNARPSEIRVSGAHGPLTPRQSQAILARLAAQAPDATALERHLALEQAVAESPLVAGNSVTILRDGAETFPAMFKAIHEAQHYLHLEYYIFEEVTCNGEHLSDLLIARRQAGVEIDVIYDGVGSFGTPHEFFDRLRAAGVQFVEFNPPNPLKGGISKVNDRDHRKILVEDGTRVLLGGVNLSADYESAPPAKAAETHVPSGVAPSGAPPGTNTTGEVWHDTDLEIEGPVVKEIDRLFEQHWQQHSQSALDRTDPPDGHVSGDEVVRIIGSTPTKVTSRYYVTVLSALRNAERTAWITAAYFVPTDQEMSDLEAAARRGVDVRLLLPSHGDSPAAIAVQHSHYSKLLKSGIKVYERTHGVLHTKAIVIDGVWSMVGSSNFDHRSVLFNDEVDAVILGKKTGAQLEAMFQGDLERAQPVDLEEWHRRSFGEKFRERFWRLWEKML
jgi:cardiolipin synthase